MAIGKANTAVKRPKGARGGLNPGSAGGELAPPLARPVSGGGDIVGKQLPKKRNGIGYGER